MERVHFQQEQMLDELKDLVEKNLFTEEETKVILKKRTEMEKRLVRRVAKKADYVRYVGYEMGLEQLRRKRVARMGAGGQTVSDYGFVRRQFAIMERAVNKFKGDVGLWVQYIEIAKREKATAVVGRVTARGLQMHPTEAALYVLAAQHEMESGSVGAARTMLQRGLRMNGESEALWVAYVRLEMGFMEQMRRRRAVLGVRADDGGVTEGAIVRAVVRSAPGSVADAVARACSSMWSS